MSPSQIERSLSFLVEQQITLVARLPSVTCSRKDCLITWVSFLSLSFFSFQGREKDTQHTSSEMNERENLSRAHLYDINSFSLLWHIFFLSLVLFSSICQSPEWRRMWGIHVLSCHGWTWFMACYVKEEVKVSCPLLDQVTRHPPSSSGEKCFRSDTFDLHDSLVKSLLKSFQVHHQVHKWQKQHEWLTDFYPISLTHLIILIISLVLAFRILSTLFLSCLSSICHLISLSRQRSPVSDSYFFPNSIPTEKTVTWGKISQIKRIHGWSERERKFTFFFWLTKRFLLCYDTRHGKEKWASPLFTIVWRDEKDPAFLYHVVYHCVTSPNVCMTKDCESIWIDNCVERKKDE